MAHYYFSLDECGRTFGDEEGQEHDSIEAARQAAMTAARGIMADEVRKGKLCLGCCIIVLDDEQQEVFRLPFRDAVTISNLRPAI